MIDQRILLVVEVGKADRVGLGGNIDEALYSSKIDYHICSPAAIGEALANFSFSCVILAVEHNRIVEASAATALTKFVENGGGLVALTSTWNEKLGPLLGISAFSSFAENCPTYTLRFTENFYPGLDELTIECDGRYLKETSIPKKNANVKLIAWDDNGTPRAWQREYGKGKVFCWNTVFIFGGHNFQGVLLQSVLICQLSAVLPIVNAAVIQIDDFPAGHTEEKLEPINTLYGVSNTEFYNKKWLPDILALGKELEIPFTWFLIFTFSIDTEPPFSFLEWDHPTVTCKKSKISYTRDSLLKLEGSGELGLHGLNHVPLVEENWDSVDNMRASLRAAIDRWQQDNFGVLPRCYVPPMNEIDPLGMFVLSEEIPSITTVCTIFSGNYEKGQARTPGFEPWNKEKVSMPRLTHGYSMTNELQLAMVSMLARLGMWTHFIHPDDIFDNPENNPGAGYYRNPRVLGWKRIAGSKESETLYGQLYDWVSFTRQNFPWLSFLTTSEAAVKLKRHLNNTIHIRVAYTEAKIDATGLADIQLCVQGNISEDNICLNGASLLYTYSLCESTLFFLRMTQLSCHLQWKVNHLPLSDPGCGMQGSIPAPLLHQVSYKKRQICFVVDKRGWAFDGVARNISKNLLHSWHPVILYTEDFEHLSDLFRTLYSEEYRFDVVHFFWRPVLATLFNPAVLEASTRKMGEDAKTKFLSYIDTCCNTTSVYDHLFLEDNEESAAQLAALEESDGCSVASSILKRIYKKQLKTRFPLKVITDGIDLEMFCPKGIADRGDKKNVLVGWAGNSAWGRKEKDHKGLNSVIKPAIECLKREGLYVEGLFCDRAEKWRPKEMMPEYYRSVDIYICASLDEGTPNPVLEAMASGLPVLSTDVGIVRDAFGPLQQSYIVSDRNSPIFIEKLRQLVTSSELRYRLSQENLRSIQKWNWKNMSTIWHDFFEGCLANSKVKMYR